MEDEIGCDDPQFMNMLETCIRIEIGIAKGTLSNLDSEIKESKVKIRKQLQARRELKENTRNTRENSMILNATLNKQRKYINEISERIELIKLNLDSDYKIMKMERDQLENICNEYEETWQAYQAKYEEFPLAKTRKEAKTRLEKLCVDKMVIEYKINELEKTRKSNEHIGWLRTRDKIVEFAGAISNGLRLDQTLADLNKSIEECKEELIVANAELAARTKKKEEEKRKRALKMLEMPPPRINFSIYGRRAVKTGFTDGWKKNYENSIDSLSVDTMVLEEMCTAEGNSVELSQLREENDPNASVSAIDESSPSPDPDDQEEAERNEVASEMEENDGQAIDPATDEEMEQEPFEEFALPSSVPKDKQTVQRSGDRTDGFEEPPVKRTKLIQDEEKAKASRTTTESKAVRAEKKKSQLVEPTTPGPRITKIESIRYNVSSLMNTDKGNLNPLVRSRSSQLRQERPEARTTKVASVRYASPARQLDQDNPNPSSMFTPRHYDYSDSSDLSFCVDNSMNLKDDQISMFGGSIRDFCECSNISNAMEGEEEMAVEEEQNASVSSTRKKAGFPQFDFSKIMKGNGGRNTLF